MRQYFSRLIVKTLAIAMALLVVFPIVYAILVSLLDLSDFISLELSFPHLVTKNYETIFRRVDIFRYVINSFIVSFICSFSRTLFGAMAAFSFVFFEFRGKVFLFLLLIGSAFLPTDLLIVENYLTVSRLGLLNSYLGICSVYLVNAMSLVIFRQWFIGYPPAIIDAARIDGCSNPQLFFRILLPSSTSVTIVAFISSFVSVWNIYLWPLLVSNTEKMRTVQVAISILKSRESPDFGVAMAGITLTLVPVLFMIIIAHLAIKKSAILWDE